ncbi:MAG: hypothetical protein U0939_05215 [Pirellulales bacterium]
MPRPHVLHFRIVGMDCADEIADLRQAVGPVVGGDDRLSFDLLNRRLIVDVGGATIAPSTIMEAIARTGMKAEHLADFQDRADGLESLSVWNRSNLWTGLSGVLLFLAQLLRAAINWEWGSGFAIEFVEHACLAGSIFCGLRLVGPKAIRAAWRLRPDMNLLMTMSSASSAARRRARSLRSPSARAWTRQRIRRIKYCLWRLRVGSPTISS